MTLAALIQRQAAARPDKPAVECRGEVLTYAAFWTAVEAMAAWFEARGVGAGDHVGLSLSESIDHVVAHYAVARLGAVLVPIDHRWATGEKARAASAFGLRLLVVDEAAAAPEAVPMLELTDARRATLTEPTAALPEDPDADWLVSLSSGTTGRPKGALVTHRQMSERFVTQWVTLGFGTADRFALVTPLYFGAGRSFAMSCLAAGGTLVLAPPPLSPEDIVATVRDTACTVTFLVPTMMRRLLSLHTSGQPPLLDGLRRLVVSGEPYHENEVAAFREALTPNLIGYYASSEGGGVSVLQPADFQAHGDTVGQAAFGVEVEVVDEHGKTVGDGETGTLRYRGPGVTTRTVDENGNTVAGDVDGWFRPGDLASIDEEGFLRLRGREKDVVVRAGVNIYPAEVERALLTHADVREVSVIGRSSASHGEELVAFVVAEPGLDADVLEAHARAALAAYKVPAAFILLDALPRAPSGKTDKKALAQLASSAKM